MGEQRTEGGTVTETPDGEQEWPLTMGPHEYLNRYPEGPHAELATELVRPPDWRERKWRIERLYMARTMQVHPHGAKSWLARLLDVTPKSVHRWCADPRDREDAKSPKPERWTQVENMERDVGREALEAAQRRLQRYYEDEAAGD